VKFKGTSRDEITKKILMAQMFGSDARDGKHPPAVEFTLAYEAARMWCEIVLRAQGLLVRRSVGHHEQTIDAVVRFLGPDVEPIVRQLQQTRKARNEVIYSGEIGFVTKTRAELLLRTLDQLEKMVLAWLKEKHPDLFPLL
jgi:hypothetical protein